MCPVFKKSKQIPVDTFWFMRGKPLKIRSIEYWLAGSLLLQLCKLDDPQSGGGRGKDLHSGCRRADCSSWPGKSPLFYVLWDTIRSLCISPFLSCLFYSKYCEMFGSMTGVFILLLTGRATVSCTTVLPNLIWQIGICRVPLSFSACVISQQPANKSDDNFGFNW